MFIRLGVHRENEKEWNTLCFKLCITSEIIDEIVQWTNVEIRSSSISKICDLCPYSTHRTTKTTCNICKKNICSEHKVELMLKKTNNQILFSLIILD